MAQHQSCISPRSSPPTNITDFSDHAAPKKLSMLSGYLDRKTLSGGVVSLSVGPSETPFDIHVELLCDRSPYFDNLLENRYAGSLPEELAFPDEAPDAFADFISWAYCGNISSAGRETGAASKTAFESPRILHLFQLWTLAEKFQVPSLRDVAFTDCKDILYARPKCLIDYIAVDYAYWHSKPGSDIRRLAVDIWAARAGEVEIAVAQRNCPSQFIEDLRDARPDIHSEAKENDISTKLKGRPPSPSQSFLFSLSSIPGDTPQQSTVSELGNGKMKAPSSARRTSGPEIQPWPWVPTTGAPPAPDSPCTGFSMTSISREIARVEDEEL